MEKEKILIVDDNPKNLAIIEIIISKMLGCEVIKAESGCEALNIINSQRDIALVLLDIQMPEIDGFEVLNRIKNNPGIQEIPVIMLTGNISVEDKVKSFNLGAVDYVTKPFQKEELIKRIETQIKLKKQFDIINGFRKKMEAELESAKELQLRLLPDFFFQSGSISIYSRYIPCFYIGGDFYDYVELSDKYLAFIIADITGHGLTASLYCAILKTLFRHYDAGKLSSAAAMKHLNNEFCGYLDKYHYITGMYSIIDKISLEICISNSAHHPPLLLRNNKIQTIEIKSENIIGLTENSDFSEIIFQLETGDRFICFTDGIYEIYNDKTKRSFFIDDLYSLILANIKSPPEIFVEDIVLHIAEISEEDNKHSFSDDITLLMLNINPFEFNIKNKENYNQFCAKLELYAANFFKNPQHLKDFINFFESLNGIIDFYEGKDMKIYLSIRHSQKNIEVKIKNAILFFDIKPIVMNGYKIIINSEQSGIYISFQKN